MDEDRIADTLNVGDRVECIRDSPDDNDSISVGMRVLSALSLTPSRILESDGTRRWLEVTTVKSRVLTGTAGSLLPAILNALMTMTSLKLMQQNWTSSLRLSQRRPLHDGSGFHKSALFAGFSGR